MSAGNQPYVKWLDDLIAQKVRDGRHFQWWIELHDHLPTILREQAAAGFHVGRDTSPPSEWQAGVESAECFIATCDYTDIDPRGPVFLRGSKTQFYACTEHWEAIIGILGRQVTTSGDAHRWWPDDDVGRGVE